MSTHKPGRIITSITIQRSNQTIAKVSLMVSVLPSSMTYAIQSSGPSIDRRFLAIACKSRADLIACGSNTPASPDILFLLSPSATALAQLAKIPASSVICIIGPMPGDSIVLPDDSQIWRLSALAPLMQLSDVSEIPDLPSPESIIIPRIGHAQTLAILESANKFNQPLLLHREFMGRTILQLCATGIWRWEFWPLGSLRHSTVSLSTSWILPLLQNAVLSALSANLCSISTPTKLGDSLNFDIFPPASIPESTSLVFALDEIGTQKKFIDTSFTIFSTLSGCSHFKAATPTPGLYALSAVLHSAKNTFHFADTIFTPSYQAEKRIGSMNTALLSSIGTVVHSDPASMTRTIAATLASNQLSIEHNTTRVHRSWQLLALIIGALATGWYLRRRWNIDS